jgi:hypothetical protein
VACRSPSGAAAPRGTHVLTRNRRQQRSGLDRAACDRSTRRCGSGPGRSPSAVAGTPDHHHRARHLTAPATSEPKPRGFRHLAEAGHQRRCPARLSASPVAPSGPAADTFTGEPAGTLPLPTRASGRQVPRTTMAGQRLPRSPRRLKALLHPATKPGTREPAPRRAEPGQVSPTGPDPAPRLVHSGQESGGLQP